MFQILQKNTPFPDPFPKGMLLLIDKPFSWTSFDVVNKVRYLVATRLGLKPKKLKVGHAGTLDPLATGLLVLCIGDYTKKIEQLQALPKAYTGVFTLGATTPSYDLEKAPDTFFPTDHLTDAKIQEALPQFIGDILQVPPMFSAVKVDGKRLYKNARTGETVEMPFRPIHIDSFSVGPLRPVPPPREDAVIQVSKRGAAIMLHPDYADGLQVDFEVHCGKGTYIRSLAHDLGQSLESGGYLSSLCRTESSGYSLKDAWDMEEFEAWARMD